MQLQKYSLGVGDRFGRQGRAQLAAVERAREAGVLVVPVWNKSFREHDIIGTRPAAVRREADQAVAEAGWSEPYLVDADHIGLGTVEAFYDSSDFFTLDVADFIGVPAGQADLDAFIDRHPELVGTLNVAGLEQPVRTSEDDVRAMAERYLVAVREAGKIYDGIASAKGKGTFVTEVSMDETALPQTPPELLVILAALADAGIPAQTIAPKFSGRFNKGVDYVGHVATFAREFSDDLAVIAHAMRTYDLPANLKISVHSGSDKFSLYGPIRQAMQRFDAGIHLKTAGTTWLEELIGLARAGDDGLAVVRDVYARALPRFDELCGPYVSVIDIDCARLPAVEELVSWDGAALAAALEHVPSCRSYNPGLRQLLHVAYRIAAEMGEAYLQVLDACRDTVADGVTRNLYDRHIRPLFLDAEP